MKLYHKIACLGLAGTLLMTTGCRKYLDVNENPNIAQEATVDLLLPSTQVTIASVMGVDFTIFGSIWGQYYTQNPNSSQYRQLERYTPTAPDFDGAWIDLYANALADLDQMDRKAAAGNQNQYRAIALLLKAYTFQMITDAWGDVPYSQAIKGLPEQGGVFTPAYDPQAAIYDGMLSMVDTATALIDPSAENGPGTDDLIYHGDMTEWLRFANTLKLRMLLRLSNVDPNKAQAGIAALNGAEFLGDGEDAQVSFISTPGNQNPLYSEMVGLSRTQNLVASSTVIDSMNANNDARIAVFFEPATNGNFVGVRQGNFNATLAPGTYSIPSAVLGANAQDVNSATAPVKLLTGYESYFLQAEAAARGWLGGNAQQLFEDGIVSNFRAYLPQDPDLTDTVDESPERFAADYIAGSNWGIYPAGGTAQTQIRHIITQKWFSMTGNQAFEAWTEWRRTGYPDFFKLSVTALVNDFPARFLYPDVEITRNINFPGTRPVTSKVYWDVN